MLDRKQKYLQIALNSTLEEARTIINQIPLDKRIIIEVGTPLIKAYGMEAIRKINSWWSKRILGLGTHLTFKSFFAKEIGKWPRWVEELSKLEEKEEEWEEEEKEEDSSSGKKSTELKKNNTAQNVSFTPYIVADLKCMDRGARETEIAFQGGAKGAIALGTAPIETLDTFILECEKYNLDSMIDMMNVEYPLNVLRQLKKIPSVVIIHRGVDEKAFDPESEIPYHEIHRIKENYDIMVAIAGGDTFPEVQRAIFNDADIVVVWKSFYQSTAQTAKLAEEFLKEIR